MTVTDDNDNDNDETGLDHDLRCTVWPNDSYDRHVGSSTTTSIPCLFSSYLSLVSLTPLVYPNPTPLSGLLCPLRDPNQYSFWPPLGTIPYCICLDTLVSYSPYSFIIVSCTMLLVHPVHSRAQQWRRTQSSHRALICQGGNRGLAFRGANLNLPEVFMTPCVFCSPLTILLQQIAADSRPNPNRDANASVRHHSAHDKIWNTATITDPLRGLVPIIYKLSSASTSLPAPQTLAAQSRTICRPAPCHAQRGLRALRAMITACELNADGNHATTRSRGRDDRCAIMLCCSGVSTGCVAGGTSCGVPVRLGCADAGEEGDTAPSAPSSLRAVPVDEVGFRFVVPVAPYPFGSPSPSSIPSSRGRLSLFAWWTLSRCDDWNEWYANVIALQVSEHGTFSGMDVTYTMLSTTGSKRGSRGNRAWSQINISDT